MTRLRISGTRGRKRGDHAPPLSHCIGYQRHGDDPTLVAYLLRNQVRTSLFFSPYPRATVQKVSSVVNLRKSFIEFAVGAEDLATEDLPGAFRAWYDAQPKNVRC